MNNQLNKLETNMVKYRDLMDIPVVESGQRLVEVASPLLWGYRAAFSDMKRYINGSIFVREEVLKRLEAAQTVLQKDYPFYSLYLTYGYRSMEIQTERFLMFLKKESSFFSDPIALYEEIHRYIAVPTVAGHPTGGAIDITIFDIEKNTFLDFGAEQYDFRKESCYVFSPGISKIGKTNRLLLRNILTNVGFAPFNGEWWHFSYGDKEWAYYYKKTEALYSQIALSDIAEFML